MAPEDRAADPSAPIHPVYRRAVAFLVEFTAVNVFVLPVVWALVGERLSGPVGEIGIVGEFRYDLSTVFVFFAFVLGRDLFFGGTSPGKRLVGLAVRDDHGQPPSIAKRVVRNVTLLLTPVAWVIEFTAAKHDGRLRRLGDRLAGTTVVDVRPSAATKPWGVVLVVAIVGTGLLRTQLTPVIYELMQPLLG